MFNHGSSEGTKIPLDLLWESILVINRSHLKTVNCDFSHLRPVQTLAFYWKTDLGSVCGQADCEAQMPHFFLNTGSLEIRSL